MANISDANGVLKLYGNYDKDTLIEVVNIIGKAISSWYYHTDYNTHDALEIEDTLNGMNGVKIKFNGMGRWSYANTLSNIMEDTPEFLNNTDLFKKIENPSGNLLFVFTFNDMEGGDYTMVENADYKFSVDNEGVVVDDKEYNDRDNVMSRATVMYVNLFNMKLSEGVKYTNDDIEYLATSLYDEDDLYMLGKVFDINYENGDVVRVNGLEDIVEKVTSADDLSYVIGKDKLTHILEIIKNANVSTETPKAYTDNIKIKNILAGYIIDRLVEDEEFRKEFYLNYIPKHRQQNSDYIDYSFINGNIEYIAKNIAHEFGKSIITGETVDILLDSNVMFDTVLKPIDRRHFESVIDSMKEFVDEMRKYAKYASNDEAHLKMFANLGYNAFNQILKGNTLIEEFIENTYIKILSELTKYLPSGLTINTYAPYYTTNTGYTVASYICLVIKHMSAMGLSNNEIETIITRIILMIALSAKGSHYTMFSVLDAFNYEYLLTKSDLEIIDTIEKYRNYMLYHETGIASKMNDIFNERTKGSK